MHHIHKIYCYSRNDQPAQASFPDHRDKLELSKLKSEEKRRRSHRNGRRDCEISQANGESQIPNVPYLKGQRVITFLTLLVSSCSRTKSLSNSELNNLQRHATHTPPPGTRFHVEIRNSGYSIRGIFVECGKYFSITEHKIYLEVQVARSL